MVPQKERHKENLNQGKIRFLSIISFFLGFLDAFFIYVISSYVLEVGGSDRVGIFYFVAFGLVLALLISLQWILRRTGNVRALLYIFVVLVSTAALLALQGPSWLGASLLLVFLALNNVMWVVMDILLEGFSTDRMSGRVRGLYLTVMNAGVLAAPFLSTQTIAHFGYAGVFAVLTFGYGIVGLAVLLGLKGTKDRSIKIIHFGETWQRMAEKPNVLRIYHISFAMEFFYAIMLVYTPLYLLQLGFQWEELGIIFTLMLIPFVLLQYPLGVVADKHWGEKELLFLGLLVIAASTAAVGFLDSASVIVWGSVLFLTRVGTATIEVLRDSYFYKQIDLGDTDIIAFFRTARPLGNMVGALIALILLLSFPLTGLFFVVTVVALSAAFSALALEDTKSEQEALLKPTGGG